MTFAINSRPSEGRLQRFISQERSGTTNSKLLGENLDSNLAGKSQARGWMPGLSTILLWWKKKRKKSTEGSTSIPRCMGRTSQSSRQRKTLPSQALNQNQTRLEPGRGLHAPSTTPQGHIRSRD